MGILFVDGCGKGWKRAALGVGVRGYPLVEKRDEWGSLCGRREWTGLKHRSRMGSWVHVVFHAAKSIEPSP
jgi:hypothetical protein